MQHGLAIQVRQGLKPDHPHLLQQYVLQQRTDAVACGTTGEQTRIHLSTYHLLLETICDSCVARHWRQLCLEHIHSPLLELKRLAKSEQEQARLRTLHQHLNTLCNYFLK